MKRLLYILVSLISLISCEKRYYVEIEDKGDLIVMNGILYSDRAEQKITLSKSTFGGLQNLSDAVVECYVNDVKVAVADCYPEYIYSEYRFNAKFGAGDKIKITAKSGDLSVAVELKAPDEPVSMSADASIIKHEEYQAKEVRLKVDMEDDTTKDNFYMLSLESRHIASTTIYSLDSGEVLDSFRDTSSILQIVPFDTGNDPILMDVYPLSSTEDAIFSEFTPKNVCKVFSDSRMNTKTTTLNVVDINYYFLTWWQSSKPYDTTVSRRELYTHPNLIVRLCSIPKDAYRYFHSINSADVYGFTSSMLTEPISFDTNVKGGLGFVTAATVKSDIVEFDPELSPYDGAIYYSEQSNQHLR